MSIGKRRRIVGKETQMPKNGQAKAIRDFYKKKAETVITAMNEYDGPDCDFCNDAAACAAAGLSEAERQALCGPQGINCPGFGGS